MEGNYEVDSLIREFPSLEVNNHLEIEVENSATNCLTLSLYIIGGQVQLCQLGIGEAVHLPLVMLTLSEVSWKATPLTSELKLTSNSIHLAPFLAASLTASRLF